MRALWLLLTKSFSILFLLVAFTATAQKTQSDNGDGTYTNPLIAADFPDPDVVKANDTWYMVTTTMFVFPGVTILQSKDLVNWSYCSNAIPRFAQDSCYDLAGCNRYGRGQWATSFKYHKGKFYLLFITLDEGGYVLTADRPEGPWQMRKLPKGFYDPGLFFDDNDRIYVAHGYSTIMMTELNEDLSPKSPDSVIFKGDIRRGLEGSHVYKIDNWYYLYATYGGLDGIQVALRSKNIYGPYEQKVVLRDTTPGINYGIHQGALMETAPGEWWTILFVDSGPFGRFPSLQPVQWIDGWPMVGVNGKAVTTYRKPAVPTQPVVSLPRSDEFNDGRLGMQWGFNHHPDNSKWSLTQRPGYLRLETVRKASDLRDARNTLTQRPFTYYNDSIPAVATTKMELQHMKPGDIAGLAVFQQPYAGISIRQQRDGRFVVMENNGVVIAQQPVKGNTIYLRATASNSTGEARFSYSTDNRQFTDLGNTLHMQFNLKVFTGNKFALFNYATETAGGYVDFDWFHVP